jgi:hypothetical protein
LLIAGKRGLVCTWIFFPGLLLPLLQKSRQTSSTKYQ